LCGEAFFPHRLTASLVNPFPQEHEPMPEGGTRTPLNVSYSWGQSGLEAQFASVFQPGQGIFSPGYPSVPPEPERLRLWDFPVGERPFATWLRELLEDLLVLDAPALEIRHNRGGDIIGLDVVDGATIKLLFDDTGRRPKPPAPAFEQVIHGRPWKLLTADELLYLPRNPRPHKAYGFGPVEQIVMTVNIALRRQALQLHHFTE